jgi:hypothetical protein
VLEYWTIHTTVEIVIISRPIVSESVSLHVGPFGEPPLCCVCVVVRYMNVVKAVPLYQVPVLVVPLHSPSVTCTVPNTYIVVFCYIGGFTIGFSTILSP